MDITHQSLQSKELKIPNQKLISTLTTQDISEKCFPREIFTGREVDFNKHCKVVFGSYEEANKYVTGTNNMNP